MYEYEHEIFTAKYQIESLEKTVENDNSGELLGVSALALLFGFGAYAVLGMGLFGVCIVAAGLIWYVYTISNEKTKAINSLPYWKSKLSLLNYEKDLLDKIANKKDKYDSEEIKTINFELKIISNLRNTDDLKFIEESFSLLKKKYNELVDIE